MYDEDVRSNIAFYHKPITMPGGYQWDHVETLKIIDLYYNSQFRDGNTDENGYPLNFYNIVKPPCDVAAKFTDLDTKDITLTSESRGIEYVLWFMQRRLRDWLKTTKFSNLMNEINARFSKYGSVVIKRMKQGDWKITNLENLRFDPSVEKLEDSSFVYEVLLMTPRELYEMKAWNKELIEEIVRINKGKSAVKIYECYSYKPEGKKWARTFRACVGWKKDGTSTIETPESLMNDRNEYIPDKILFEDETDELPYRELHWERVPGRWLGLGFVELLVPNQIRLNDLEQMKVKALRISSLHIFQTKDDSIGKNVLDLDNGEILQGEVSPIANEERNLQAFVLEEQRWDINTQQKTFSFDIARGGSLPSQTPLGVAQLSASMVASYFNLKQENFGLFIRDLILDDILPEFKKQNKKKHIMKFLVSDKETSKLRSAMMAHRQQKAFWDYAMRTGTIPTPMAWEMEKIRLEGAMKKRQDFTFEIPESFYDMAEGQFDVLVTGEQLDVGTRMQTYQNAMGIIASNPNIILNPSTRSIFFKMLELAGVSPVDLDLMQEEAANPMNQQMQPQQQMPTGGPQPQTQQQRPTPQQKAGIKEPSANRSL